MSDDIVVHLRRRAVATDINPDILLDTQAADEIERLRADRAGDQQRLFHYEAKIAELTGEINYLSLPPSVIEAVEGIVRSAPGITRAEALDIVEKAVAKVFNAAVP
jgi:hypothetical protein